MARRWITAEDKQLGVLYQQGVSLRAIAAALNRTEEGVGARRRALGLPARPRSRPWSAREEQLLSAAHRQGLPASALASTLCRTPEQIRRRRRALFGTSRAGRPYTSIEDAAIRLTFHPAADIAQIAADLGRSPGSVQHRARKLGLYHPPRRTRWQEHEDATLRDGYTRGLTCQQIAAQLPHRSPGAAAARAASSGSRPTHGAGAPPTTKRWPG